MGEKRAILEIDGALGEGGGQVLRSSLALSVITGKAIHIENIRARRLKPGLRAQHLKSVDAAAAISKASVTGAELGSSSLTFTPKEIRSGRYKFDIGTAGSTGLVLQTIFAPLSLATTASSVIIKGGTHVPWSPCFHYLDLHWLPYMRQIGFDAQLTLDQAGFYPKGGGRIHATIRSAQQMRGLSLTQRGKLASIHGLSAVANLTPSIADRQKRQALLRLQNLCKEGIQPEIKIKTISLPSPVKGTFLLLLAQFEGGRCCFYSLGELGKPAERVADEAVDELLAFLETPGAIDPYLADQLLMPLCLSQDVSHLSTSRITWHLLTNAQILQAFLPVKIDIDAELDQPGLVHIIP
jgi:RNA 3'-phosphate cyclase